MLDLRTSGALVIFVCVLLAYTVQTELAQYVQQHQKYHKSYFLFYLTHSGYALLLPLHILVLKILRIDVKDSFRILRLVVRHKFSNPKRHEAAREDLALQRRPSLRNLLSTHSPGRRLWKQRFLRTVFILTLFIAMPSLSWYAAVPLTTMTDITAIYNVFAFWAYIMSVRLLGEPATPWKLASVLLAVCGVFVIAYGDAVASGGAQGATAQETKPSSSRLAGNLLAFVGSITYAWYEVWYKINVALPMHDDAEFSDDDDSAIEQEELLADEPESVQSFAVLDPEISRPSTSTYLLYSNFVTSIIGVGTLLVLWIPIPILHFMGWETFELPPRQSLFAICGIIFNGICFNAGFMVLLSLWGPVIASVGNLCTLVLVALADTFIAENENLSLPTIVGGSMVIVAFLGLIKTSKSED